MGKVSKCPARDRSTIGRTLLSDTPPPTVPEATEVPMRLPPHLAAEIEGLPQELRDAISDLPTHLVEVAATAPLRVNRRAGAELLARHVHPVSPRTLEIWHLPWWNVNGHALTLTVALLALAHRKLAQAPMVMGGRRQPASEA